MRFYFHISTGAIHSEDEEGMELPGVIAALNEADKIAEELRANIEDLKLTNSVVQIVSASGQFFVTVPIATGHDVRH